MVWLASRDEVDQPSHPDGRCPLLKCVKPTPCEELLSDRLGCRLARPLLTENPKGRPGQRTPDSQQETV